MKYIYNEFKREVLAYGRCNKAELSLFLVSIILLICYLNTFDTTTQLNKILPEFYSNNYLLLGIVN